jgi:hypothetical protein
MATAMSALDKTSRIQMCHLTIQTSEPHVFEHKSRSIRMFHTENLKLEENSQKNIFFLKVSSRTSMYNQLIKQLNSISKKSKDIIKS